MFLGACFVYCSLPSRYQLIALKHSSRKWPSYVEWDIKPFYRREDLLTLLLTLTLTLNWYQSLASQGGMSSRGISGQVLDAQWCIVFEVVQCCLSIPPASRSGCRRITLVRHLPCTVPCLFPSVCRSVNERRPRCKALLRRHHVIALVTAAHPVVSVSADFKTMFHFIFFTSRQGFLRADYNNFKFGAFATYPATNRTPLVTYLRNAAGKTGDLQSTSMANAPIPNLAQYLQSSDSKITRVLFFLTSIIIFTGVKKYKFWPRFSTQVACKTLWFRNEAVS